MTARIQNTRLDVARQTLRCTACGDEIPFPLGDVAWVLAITRAFADAHRGRKHQGGRTAFVRATYAPAVDIVKPPVSEDEIEYLEGLRDASQDRSAEVTGV